MFKKILIANRGEIACRVMKTARQMGIKTVAVYSEADAAAKHVRMADEAVLIGPAASAESYLVAEKLIQACKDTGAEAVHPGYGFVSENAAFAEALDKAGIAFIGPGIRAIQAMGDKIESKKLANEAGVNTVPGFLGVLKDADEAVKVSGEIGYPVMIKASAGGGGKGMRVANNDDEAREGFRLAVNEAVSSFGDDRVFIEKFVQQPRHIEIQVLADKHGNTIYLGERECSIQRRHQKVIEEAPSPFIDEATRKAMGEQAVELAKAVDYCSAGTVEFIVDGERNFYFLEMNTRLQVEHPVTELITGVDLVEQMIRIAAGEKLNIAQEDVTLTGWAMESRVYAEDPYRNFLPSTGRLVRYAPPVESDTVRVDDGVYEGAEISMFYDPMIAKLVTYGADRAAAIEQMIGALNRFRIRGVGHNLPFLSATMAHSRFRSGNITTNFIAEEFADGFVGADLLDEDRNAIMALAVAYERYGRERNARMSGQISNRPASQPPSDWIVRDGQNNTHLQVAAVDDGYDVGVGDTTYQVRGSCDPLHPIFEGSINGRAMPVQIDRDGLYYSLSHGGSSLRLLVIEQRVAELLDKMPVKEAPDMSRYLLSPMPGLLISVAVEEGQAIKAGQELCVVEAMKMENVMRAERDGVIQTIHANAGDSLIVDQAIIEFE